MTLFERKPIEKESNIASAPAHVKAPSPFSAKKFYLLLFNVLSMAFYCIYVFYIIFRVPEISYLYDILVFVLYGYGIALILILILSIGKKSKLKTRLKNYKSAVKFLQYTIQIVSFVLLIVTALSSLFTTGKLDFVALTSAFWSLIVTCIMIFIEIIKIMIRRNIPVVKENFLRLKEEDTIYNKIYKGYRKIKKANTNLVDNNTLEVNDNEKQKEDDPDNLNYLIQPVNQSSDDNTNDTNNQIDSQPEEEPKLEKNQRYDRNAGVIIEYDEDEEDDEDTDSEDSFLDIQRDNHINPKGKLSNFLKRFNKK